MSFLLILLCAAVTASARVVIPRDSAAGIVTVTVPCESGRATDISYSASSIKAVATSSTPSPSASVSFTGASVTLGPVPNPSTNPSDLSNIVPKSNLTIHYGSNDTSTPATNTQVSVQMKYPSVLLEDISSVDTVVCSDTGVVVTFNDAAGYEKSTTEWPVSGDFILFTNHFGNCDAEFERGLFVVGGLVFDQATLTVTATAEKSDFQSTAGAMQLDFGQIVGSSATTGPYSNTTAISQRDITWDPTYSLNFTTALPANTQIVSIPPYLSVTANAASFTSSATFSGHLDFNFWAFKVEQLYVDLDVAFDAYLALTAAVNAAYTQNFQYAPATLAVAPINIPGILTLGPAVVFAIGAHIGADAIITVTTSTDVNLKDGNVHVDFLNAKNTAASGWKPTYSATATVDVDATVEVNPYVQLEVELAVNFLSGLLDLSSGIKANATLSNVLTAEAGISAGTGTGVTVPSGVCDPGLEYKSDFLFAITGFVTQFYSVTIWQVDVPLFDKCWTWG